MATTRHVPGELNEDQFSRLNTWRGNQAYKAPVTFYGDVRYAQTDMIDVSVMGEGSAAIQAAHDALPTGGGTIIVPNGNRTWTSNLSITKPNVRMLLGKGTQTMAAYTITVDDEADGFVMEGYGSWGWESSTAIQTYLLYTGTGTALTVGNSGGAYNGLELKNFMIQCTGAGGKCITLNRVIIADLNKLRIFGSSDYSQYAVYVDSTGGSCQYVNMYNCWVSNPKYGLYLTGTGFSTTVNIYGGTFSGPGVGVSGGTAIYFGGTGNSGNANCIFGTNIQSWETGLNIQTSDNVVNNARFETNTTDVVFGASAARNHVMTANASLTVTDGGTNNGVWNAGTMHFGAAGYLKGIEISDPSAPAANSGILYFKDSGAGKTRLVARFPSGDVQTIATEP